jgi:hypothetical protein
MDGGGARLLPLTSVYPSAHCEMPIVLVNPFAHSVSPPFSRGWLAARLGGAGRTCPARSQCASKCAGTGLACLELATSAEERWERLKG